MNGLQNERQSQVVGSVGEFRQAGMVGRFDENAMHAAGHETTRLTLQRFRRIRYRRSPTTQITFGSGKDQCFIPYQCAAITGTRSTTFKEPKNASDRGHHSTGSSKTPAKRSVRRTAVESVSGLNDDRGGLQ